MNILLVNPTAPAALKKENLGLAQLAACLEADRHRVRIADEIAGQDVEEILDEFSPDLVGISAMTMFAPHAYRIADAIRGTRGIPVVLGGAHPTALPEEALGHADCVLLGEGERTFPALLATGKLEGIVEPDPPDELDDLPLPARDKLDLDYYAEAGEELAGLSLRTLGAITSRGCPYHCTFCVNSKRQTRVRFHSAERVLEEIRYLVERHHIESIAFYDELMGTDAKRLREISEGMVRKGFHTLRWECQMHTRTVKSELLEHMKKAGCVQVAIGFESGSQAVLDTIAKDVTVEENLEAARRVREAGLRLRACFVMGAPGETLDDIRMTRRFIKSARVDFASIHYLTPYPGTLLFDRFAGQIAAKGIPWDRFTTGDPACFTCNDAIPADEQERLFARLSAQQALRNYSWGEMLRRAIRNPHHAWHVVKSLLS